MGSLLDILNKLQTIDVDLSASVAMEETANAAVIAQRSQLARGERADGTEMPEYSFRSVFQYGKEPGPIKLYDTGDFYRGILFDVRQDIYILDSADYKTTMLSARYGEAILGLGRQAREEYILTLKPEFYRQIVRYLDK